MSLSKYGGLGEWLNPFAWKANMRQKRIASSNLASSAICRIRFFLKSRNHPDFQQ